MWSLPYARVVFALYFKQKEAGHLILDLAFGGVHCLMPEIYHLFTLYSASL